MTENSPKWDIIGVSSCTSELDLTDPSKITEERLKQFIIDKVSKKISTKKYELVPDLWSEY